MFHKLDFREKAGLNNPTLARFCGILWAIWLIRNNQVFRQSRATMEGLQLNVDTAMKQHQLFSDKIITGLVTSTTRDALPPGFLMIDIGQLSLAQTQPQLIFCIDGSWDASIITVYRVHGLLLIVLLDLGQNMQGQKVFASSALQTEIRACHLAVSWANSKSLLPF